MAGVRCFAAAGTYFKTCEDQLVRMTDKRNGLDVVLFDFGGVIAEEGWRAGMRIIAENNGLDYEKFLSDANDTIYASGYLLGKSSESTFWNALREKTGIVGDDVSLMKEIFPRFIPRDWMIQIVKELKREHFRVGILSDQTDMLDKLDKKFNFFHWFDYVFNSYHLGKGKRDASLFDDIAGVLEIPPERILFVDDDPGHIGRARQRGWQAIHYVNRIEFMEEMTKHFPVQSKDERRICYDSHKDNAPKS